MARVREPFVGVKLVRIGKHIVNLAYYHRIEITAHNVITFYREGYHATRITTTLPAEQVLDSICGEGQNRE
jgi:hypothetical protein